MPGWLTFINASKSIEAKAAQRASPGSRCWYRRRPGTRFLAVAARLRSEHRGKKELRALYDMALRSYRTRILDNIDLDRLPDLRARAAVVARAMIDRGDARAFAMGRRMLDCVGAMEN